jgi:hypothetical protein
MTINPEFKVYAKYSKLMSIYDEKITRTKKSAVDRIIPAILWTDIKGQRIDLDVFFESILLNGSLKHIALLSHLRSNNK